MYATPWTPSAFAPSSTEYSRAPPSRARTKAIVSNLALPQIRVGVLFPVVVGWALWVRRTDPDTHKRLMILATVPKLMGAEP